MTRYTKDGKYISFGGLQLSTPPQTTPRNGLIAEWLFSGNSNDTSGNNYNGTNFGDPTLVNDRFGNIDSAYDFSGGAKWVESFPIINLNNDYTVSLWFKQGIYSLNMRLFAFTNSIGSFPIVSIYNTSDGNLRMQYFNDAGSYTNGTITSYNTSIWNHTILSKNENVASLYINNEFKNSVNISGTYNNNNIFGIGSLLWNSNPSQFYNGIIDDIRIYNRIITPKERTELYKEGGYN